MQRDDKRKPIAESDEEEDMKKVSYTFQTPTVCSSIYFWDKTKS